MDSTETRGIVTLWPPHRQAHSVRQSSSGPSRRRSRWSHPRSFGRSVRSRAMRLAPQRIARELGISRNTVTRYLRGGAAAQVCPASSTWSAYRTSIRSSKTRTRTHSPISRDGTE
jgi:hypothetical protein